MCCRRLRGNRRYCSKFYAAYKLVKARRTWRNSCWKLTTISFFRDSWADDRHLLYLYLYLYLYLLSHLSHYNARRHLGQNMAAAICFAIRSEAAWRAALPTLSPCFDEDSIYRGGVFGATGPLSASRSPVPLPVVSRAAPQSWRGPFLRVFLSVRSGFWRRRGSFRRLDRPCHRPSSRSRLRNRPQSWRGLSSRVFWCVLSRCRSLRDAGPLRGSLRTLCVAYGTSTNHLVDSKFQRLNRLCARKTYWFSRKGKEIFDRSAIFLNW